MEKLKKLGEGNRPPIKKTFKDTSPVYQSELNEVVDKINEQLDYNDSLVEGDTELSKISFDKDYAGDCNEGEMVWNDDTGTAIIGMKGSDVCLNVGQEMFVPRAKNGEDTTITNGTLVYVYGATGNNPIMKRASSTDVDTASKVLAMATEDVLSNQFGFFTAFGLVNDINTNSFTAGDSLYLGESGAFVNSIPTNGVKVNIGYVIRKGILNGSIFITIDKDFFTKLYCPADLEIELQPNKTLALSEPAWRDEYPAVIVPASGSAAPDSVAHTIGGIARQLYSFDGVNTEERLSGSFEIPHDYMIGQPIEVHIHWRPSTTGTGVVKWFFDWELSKVHQAPSAQTTLTITSEITSASQYVHFITTFGNLPALDYGIGDKIGFNIRRTPSDAADTYGADALLEQVALHIPVDTLGSRQIYVK